MKQFLYLCLLFCGIFSSCQSAHYQLQTIEGRQLEIDQSIPGNDSLETFIAPYRERISREMNRVLSYAPEHLNKNQGDLNSPLGNMMADAVMEMAGPIFTKRTGKNLDIVLLNHGGIRAGISQGDISVGTAFELMPFENEVVVAALDAAGERAMVDYLANEQVPHPLAGMQIVVDGQDQPAKVLVGGRPIEERRTYYVATNDYLYEGGDRMTFFSASQKRSVLDYKIRNLLIDYFQKKDTITATTDNRFIRRQ